MRTNTYTMSRWKALYIRHARQGHVTLIQVGTIGTLMPVVLKTISHSSLVFSQQFLAATTITKVTSLTHEGIPTESNNHLSLQLKSPPDEGLRAMPLKHFTVLAGMLFHSAGTLVELPPEEIAKLSDASLNVDGCPPASPLQCVHDSCRIPRAPSGSSCRVCLAMFRSYSTS